MMNLFFVAGKLLTNYMRALHQLRLLRLARHLVYVVNARAGVRENAPNFDENPAWAATRSSPHAVSPRVIRRRRSSSNELISKVNLQNDETTSALKLLTVKGASWALSAYNVSDLEIELTCATLQKLESAILCC